MKWVIHEHVARHSYKPSISESSVYSTVQPPQRSLLPLRLIILISVFFFSVWAVAGLGICVPTLPCALPLNRLNHGRCFLCGNADAQTVFEDFLFRDFICVLFAPCHCGLSVSDWLRGDEKWQINTCVERLLLFVLCVLLWISLSSLFTLQSYNICLLFQQLPFTIFALWAVVFTVVLKLLTHASQRLKQYNVCIQ